MCGISTFKKFLQYYDKNKKKPFLSCRIVIKKKALFIKKSREVWLFARKDKRSFDINENFAHTRFTR